MKVGLTKLVIDAFAVDLKIWHAVAGFDVEVFVAGVIAQRAMAIVDAYFRNQWKREPSNRVETEHMTRYGRKYMQPDKVHQPVRSGSESKETIGRVQEAFGIFQALFVVAF